jgi:hypothetical protein
VAIYQTLQIDPNGTCTVLRSYVRFPVEDVSHEFQRDEVLRILENTGERRESHDCHECRETVQTPES